MLRPPVALVRRRRVRQELHRASVGVCDPDGSFTLLVRQTQRVEVRGRLVRRAGGMELEADVVEPRLAAGDQLERVRLVVAREEGAAVAALALDEAELDAPPGRRLVEVGDPQPDVVDAAEADQTPAFRDPPLGLVLGDRERDVEGLGRDLELLSRPGEVDVPLDDRRS